MKTVVKGNILHNTNFSDVFKWRCTPYQLKGVEINGLFIYYRQLLACCAICDRQTDGSLSNIKASYCIRMKRINDLIKIGFETLDVTDTSVAYHNRFHDTHTPQKYHGHRTSNSTEFFF